MRNHDPYGRYKPSVFEFIGDVLVVLSPFALIAIVIALSAWGFSHTCNVQLDAMNRGGDWRFFGGCLVEVEDGLVPLDNLRFNDDGSLVE